MFAFCMHTTNLFINVWTNLFPLINYYRFVQTKATNTHMQYSFMPFAINANHLQFIFDVFFSSSFFQLYVPIQALNANLFYGKLISLVWTFPHTFLNSTSFLLRLQCNFQYVIWICDRLRLFNRNILQH